MFCFLPHIRCEISTVGGCVAFRLCRAVYTITFHIVILLFVISWMFVLCCVCREHRAHRAADFTHGCAPACVGAYYCDAPLKYHWNTALLTFNEVFSSQRSNCFPLPQNSNAPWPHLIFGAIRPRAHSQAQVHLLFWQSGRLAWKRQLRRSQISK